MATTAGPWGNPDAPDYAQSNIVSVNVDGISFQVNKNVVTQFSGLIHDLVQAGYHPHSVGGYNNRDITGGSGKSNHAYGAAIDIDPGDNPRYVGKDGKHTLDSGLARQLAAKWGLNWGGDYKNSKDYMHFEAQGAPRSKGSPPGGTLPVITPAAKAAGATVGTPASGGAGVGAATVAPATMTGTQSTNPNAPGYTLPPNATDAQVKDYVSTHYGYLAGFLHDPEISKILLDAARGGWDKDVLAGRLSQTKYWKTTSDTARTWDAQTKTDAASQHQQVVNTQAAYAETAKKNGITIDPLALHDLTVTSLRLGWNSQQVDAALRAHGKLNPTTAKTAVSGLKQQAEGDYLVKLSDPALQQWANDISSGKFTADDYTNYLKEQAKSLFPGMANAIDRGITVGRYVDPYRQQAASLLEINPDSIDFVNDPKFSKALFNTDPKTGERTQMSLADWQNYLRKTPDYNKTAGAIDQAAQFATLLTKTFGKAA